MATKPPAAVSASRTSHSLSGAVVARERSHSRIVAPGVNADGSDRGRLREASGPSFVIVRNWVAQRPPHGVSGTGDVKRQEFYHGKEKWRIDVINVHGTNLRV